MVGWTWSRSQEDIKKSVLRIARDIMQRLSQEISGAAATLSHESHNGSVYLLLRARLAHVVTDLRSSYRFAVSVRVLTRIIQNLVMNRVCSKRELYYQDKGLYERQSVSDAAVEQWAATFNVPRECLNIVSMSKGLMYGPLSFRDRSNTTVDCSVNESGTTIPGSVLDLQILSMPAHFILVVEKECVFRRLLEVNVNSICLTRTYTHSLKP